MEINKQDEERPIPIITRLASMLLDHVFMTMIMGMVLIPFLIGGLTAEGELEEIPKMALYAMAFGYALYFFKDAVHGRSFAKRILKFQIVDNKTGKVASPIKCVLRNILIPLWFFEVVPALFNPSRRLGDFLAGTKLVHYDAEKHQVPMDWAQLFIAFLMAIAFCSFLLSGLEQMMGQMVENMQNMQPVEPAGE